MCESQKFILSLSLNNIQLFLTYLMVFLKFYFDKMPF